ncbi:MAG: NBR1-Ig-like domain-containing protein [Chloroflexota bacterium]
MRWQRLFGVVLLAGMLLSQSISQAAAAADCDWAQYVSDPSVPDGTSFRAGAAFTKTWRLTNIGACTWTTRYKVVYLSGSQMGAPASVNLPVDVLPGQTVDISVNMTAPTAPGRYIGSWVLSNEAGVTFGIGASAANPFWVDINVVETNTVIYDFVANAPYAEWKSASGILPYPGTSGDSRGYSYQINDPHLEDDSIDTLPGLLMVPHNKYNGTIQATYPEFLVQQGDHFQTLVNCEFGASGCYVVFNLNYMTATGSVRTFWTRKEAHEGRFYRADIDLSRLAGQRVRFILNISSAGFASGDRALWGAPRIMRAGTVQPPAPAPTLTPLPALTPTPTPFSTPPPLSPAACERASFVADITVPDGTVFSPAAAFTKTWRLKNTGSCAWTTSYNFVYYSGSQMSAPTVLRMPRTIAPGQTVDLALNMVAPPAEGVYRGNWILQSASGALFGIGKDASMPVWVEIRVAGEAPQESLYDFVKNACAAYWITGTGAGAGVLACPGVDRDLSGFVLPLNSTQLEDGTRGPAPSLLMAPQYKYNGMIQGFYPAFTVQPGDRFQAAVGCEYGSSCYVTFRLDTMSASGSISNFWSWREQNDGRYYNANIDLTPLAGRSVRFILTLFSSGSPAGDRAVWAAPRIVRRGPPITITITPTHTSTPTLTPTSTPTPTLTPTPTAATWLTLINPTYGFQLRYPSEGQIVSGGNDHYTRIDLPFQPGTNLREKYLEVIATQNPTTCVSPLGMSSILNTSENVTINGLTFLKETGGDGGAGHLHEWVAYSIAQGSTCVSLDFILHSLNPGNFPTPPPVYDKAAESAVFESIVSTFAWTSSNSDWLTYTNTKYGFRFMYPPEGQVTEQNDNGAHITLPIIPGTNLTEKYLDLAVVENAAICHSPVQMAPPPIGTSETVTINGLAFLKEISVEAAAGNHYNLVVYSIPQGSTCVSFVFILHSIAAGNVDPPLPEFDMAAESAVFQNILATFAWLPVNPTAKLTAVVDALNAQNFDAAQALMDQTFGFGFWGSEGTSSTPDLAIQQLQANYIGPNTHLIPDPNKDLVALLGGSNPYSIMGLDPARSQALFVSGWGLDGRGEAILYVTSRLDGSPYWHSVLIAPQGFAVNNSFCTDDRIVPLITQFKQSMTESNGTIFASLVSPQHGMDITFWHGGTTVNYTTVTAQNIFNDQTVVNWGAAPGEGGPGHSGTFAQIVQPDLIDVFNSNYQLNCNDPSYAYMYPYAWPYPGIDYYSIVKPPTNTFDWKVWLVGFEYVDGQPYLYGAIHWVWSP